MLAASDLAAVVQRRQYDEMRDVLATLVGWLVSDGVCFEF